MEEKKSNGLSIAALVCGIVGIVGMFISVIAPFTLILSILGVVFGVLGRKKCASKGMGTAGLVLGIIGLAFSLIGVLCFACICLAATGGAGLAVFA